MRIRTGPARLAPPKRLSIGRAGLGSTIGPTGLAPKQPKSLRPRPRGAFGAVGTPAGGGAAPTPAGSSLPPVRTPDDARYQSEINALTRNRNDSDLASQNRENDIRSSFGFDPQYASNPYTQANLLDRAAKQRFAGTTNARAAAGRLYSGATNRAREADAFASGQALDTARRNYSTQLAQIAQERLANQRRFDEGRDTAYADLLDRMAGQEPDASLYDSGVEGGGGGAPGVKGRRGKPGPKRPGKFTPGAAAKSLAIGPARFAPAPRKKGRK